MAVAVTVKVSIDRNVDFENWKIVADAGAGSLDGPKATAKRYIVQSDESRARF